MYELRSKSFQLSVFLAVVYVCSERMYWVIVGMSFFHAVIWGICLQLCFVRSKFYNIVCGLHLSSVSACLFVFLGCFGVFFFEKPSLSDIDPKVMEKKIFKNTKANFHSFLTNSPIKWTCPFIWNLNWQSLTPKDMVIPRLFDIDPKDLEKIFKTLKNKCVFHLS